MRRLKRPRTYIGRLIACLCLVVGFHGLAEASKVQADENLLRFNASRADVIAHINVHTVVALKKSDGKTRYLIEAHVVKSYLGKLGEWVLFNQWSEADLVNRMRPGAYIVALRRSNRDQQYYTLEPGGTLTADPTTLSYLKHVPTWARGTGRVLDAKTCRNRTEQQPGGSFGLQIYCDDALGINVAVVKHRFSAPIEGAYLTSNRYWQAGSWGTDVVSYLWSQDRKSLFLSTSAYNGEGAVYRLNLESKSHKKIWSRKAIDCLPKLSNQYGVKLTIKVVSCDQKNTRTVSITLK